MLTQVIIYCSLLLIFFLWRFNRNRIRYWVALLNERGWKSTIHYDRCLKIFKKLYDNVNAMKISINERKERGIYSDSTYTYGEVTFYSFVKILEMAHPKPGEVFYDLGSGAGKAVMIAGLVYDFSKVCGIEQLNGLYELSMELRQKFQDLPEVNTLFPQKKNSIQFIHGDFLQQDISDGDIIFISATCFRGEMLNELIVKLLKLKVGARIILGSANLEQVGGFELKYSNMHLMSWGLNTVNIYQRI